MTTRIPLMGWIGICVIALAIFLPAVTSLPVTDRDEARFVQSSRQMVQSGDPVDIRFQDQQRMKKPAGIYWLQASAVLLSGQGDQAPLWVYRLPSVAGAVVSILLLAAIGTTLFGPSPALLASMLFATGLIIGGEARIAKTDAMLLASTLSAMLVLARLFMAGGTVRTPRRYAFVFWLSVAVAILIKGPIGPMVLALTIACLAVLRHPMNWLRPLMFWQAILAATVVALPWFLAITWQSSGAFWQGSVGADLMAKVVSGQEGKGAPPGSYLVAMWLTFWPASVALILALPQIWQARQTKAVQFLLAWIIPTWLLFEAVPTKLVHYTLPTYPALALLAAAFAPVGLAKAGLGLRWVAMLALLPGLGLGVAVLNLAIRTEAEAVWPMAVGLALACVTASAAALAILRQRTARLGPLLALTGAALMLGLYPALARLPVIWPGERAFQAAMASAASQSCPSTTVSGWGYAEPSLVWQAGAETQMFSAKEHLPPSIAAAPCAFVLRAVVQDQAPAPASCQTVATVSGFALGAGRWITLDVLSCGKSK